jgi:CheY-like chemotaxis protein
VSHELRTPLNIILGFVDVMQQSPEVYGDVNWTPILRRDLSEIQRSAHYLSSLVDDILDLARMQALKMPIHREQTDIRALVEEALALAGRLLLQKPGVRLDARFPAALPSVHVDQTRIRQVLLNLLANACRFTSEGEVAVKVELDEMNVTIAVSDTGAGIAPDELGVIFEEFESGSVEEPLPEERVGKGLGLAIARRFVRMHGGRIWAESELGKGSTFYLTLPLAGEQVVPLSAAVRGVAPEITGEQVLVLVGDAEGQAFLDRHLDGYRVLAAPDLLAARALARETHPRAIIVNAPPPPEGATQAPPLPFVPEPVPVLQCSLPVGMRGVEREVFGEWLVKPITRERLLLALARFPQARRVFLVDDDKGFVRLVRRMLSTQRDRYEVAWAHSGEEALAALQAQPADVVVLDMAMPGINGWDLAQMLRGNDTAKPPALIAVTALQPGLEGQLATPRLFAVTSSTGFGEEDTLQLIRACLGQLTPDFAVEWPAPGNGETPLVRPA